MPATEQAAAAFAADELVAAEFAPDQFLTEADYARYRNYVDPLPPIMPSAALLAQTEVRGPPWDLSILEGIELPVEGGDSDGQQSPSCTYQFTYQFFNRIDPLSDAPAEPPPLLRWRDMFIHYSPQQAAYVAKHSVRKSRAFIGPDYFFMCDGDPTLAPDPSRSRTARSSREAGRDGTG